jgi:GDP-D-mannose dehydratase
MAMTCRENYGLYACSGILYNHVVQDAESFRPLTGNPSQGEAHR